MPPVCPVRASLSAGVTRPLRHKALRGRAVCTSARQSNPSSSSPNCAAVSETAPSCACGQIKRPCSKRLANRHSPPLVHHKALSKCPRRPRNKNTCPENGSPASTVCTFAAKVSKPQRMSPPPPPPPTPACLTAAPSARQPSQHRLQCILIRRTLNRELCMRQP